ncbi:unnamed protein product [Choristocarpus tenellus]
MKTVVPSLVQLGVLVILAIGGVRCGAVRQPQSVHCSFVGLCRGGVVGTHVRLGGTESCWRGVKELSDGRSCERACAVRGHRRKACVGPCMVASSPLGPDISTHASKTNERLDSFNAGIINALKGLMTAYYGDRIYARFYALETIARVPYFSYVSVLHLYETLGLWRKAEYLKIHFAESYNEMHHLLIMEELGGNTLFWDRWFAQHAAFFYFFVVVGMYMANPLNAYNLNQHVEEHAFATYDAFIAEEGDKLKEQPAPEVARQYYGNDKLYVFNGLHNDPEGVTFEERDLLRPVMDNLYDAFVAVRNDEWEHVKTMIALQKRDSTD